MSVGVVVGCDAKQEWLLSWWYAHFRKHNPTCEIAFADFGMTPVSQNWCKERGYFLEIPRSTLQPQKGRGFLYKGEEWEMPIGNQPWAESSERLSWFLKPIAIKKSPFHRAIWIDLDCQIHGELTPLLSFSLKSAKIAIRPTNKCMVRNVLRDEVFVIKSYNGGVIVMEKDSPLLDLWVDGVERGAVHYFYGDDLLLSFYLALHRVSKMELPLKYNWKSPDWGPNPQALISHWEGERGKLMIRLYRS